jgi:hypothetical protein
MSTTLVVAFFRRFSLTTSVNDTGGKFATGFNNTGNKFATNVNDTGGK